jgi:multidrug efflux pump subunit AcrB
MRSIIAYFIKFPAAGNVLLIGILLFGAVGMSTLRSDFFPDTESRNIKVELTYPGASPEEMEEGVILRIEDNLKGITGIERITSVAKENSGSINVEGVQDYDMDLLLTDVKNAVDRIASFPVDLEPPVIFKQESRNLAIGVALSGDVDLRTLKDAARNVETDLLAVDGISKVDLAGFPAEEIEIAVREVDMRAYQLTFSDVRDAIRNANLDLTGGTIKTEEEEMLIRARSKEYYAAELENIIVSTSLDGRSVRLYEISEVRDRWADSPNRAYLNGLPSVALTVSNTTSEDVLFITDYVKEYVETFNQENDRLQATVTQDFSVSLRQRRDILVKNGVIGFILVLFFLAIFLNIRLAFWVALAIPVCFMGMFLVGSLVGLTINVISLFGMIIVVGILVDDGIVIGENIYQQYEKGKGRMAAAVDGTMEVFPAVLTAIMTTIAAFSAFYFLDGRTGEIFSEMGFVVILTLFFSLVEGALILPGHVAHSKALQQEEEPGRLDRLFSRVEKRTNALLNWLKYKLYAPMLRTSIRYPLLALCLPLGLLLVGAGLVQGGFVSTTFFPFIDSNNLSVTLKMPSGTREQVTDKWMRYIEEQARELNEELKAERGDGIDVVERISRRIGPTAADGTVDLALLDGEARGMPSSQIGQMLRKKIGKVYEAEQLTVGGRTFFGKPVSIAMMGNNLEQLDNAVNELKAAMEELEEVKDITDSNQEGLRELNVELKEKARYLGLSMQDVIGQVRQGFFGAEVQRLQRGEDEVRVWVRYDVKDRSSVGKLEQMRIRLPDGREFPLEELATLREERGVIAINRIDGKREIRVEGDLASSNTSATDVNATIRNELLPPILAKYPDIRASFEGQARSAQQTQESGTRVMIVIFFIMYLMSVLTFRSWGQALLIIPLLLPFGLIGVVVGHWIHGHAMSMLSLLGIIALFGIMINDSLVLIAQFNNLIRQGRSFGQAVYEAGLSRFRAILLTSLTTVAGLYPLILETSFQARFLVPMAVSVAYGLIFGTFIILATVPAMLVLLNNYRVFLAWAWDDKKPRPEMVEPGYVGRLSYTLLWAFPLFVAVLAFVASLFDINPMWVAGPLLTSYGLAWIIKLIGNISARRKMEKAL